MRPNGRQQLHFSDRYNLILSDLKNELKKCLCDCEICWATKLLKVETPKTNLERNREFLQNNFE